VTWRGPRQLTGDKVLTVNTLGPRRTGAATSRTRARTEEEEQWWSSSSPAQRIFGVEGGGLVGWKAALGHEGAPGPARKGGEAMS
jgi:hypothetical protein